MGLRLLAKTPIFRSKLFFQMPLENFLYTLWPCLRYLKGSPDIVLYVSKKIRAIRHVKDNIFKEKYKKTDFEEIQSQNGVATSCQNPYFSLETFFQMLLENFLDTLWPCSRYLKGPPDIVLYVNKKSRAIRRVKEKIFKEKYKKPDFWKIRPQNGVGASCQNPYFHSKLFFKCL